MSDSESKENEEEIIAEDTEEVLSVDYDTEKQLDPNGPVNTDHQDNDLDLVTVKKFIGVSFAVTIAFFVLMLVVLRFYKTDFEDERGVAKVEDRQIPGKDDALLQTQPLMDLKEYNDLEASRLNMTTNAIEHAVIPVEAAKQLMLAENAFPTPTPAKASEERSEPAESMVAKSSPMIYSAPAAETSAPIVARSTSVASAPIAEKAPEVAIVAEPEMEMITEAAPDPMMVAAGEEIFTGRCMVCHTGKRGAIGPNIQKAYGSMRKIENHDPILMDHDYIINSMNNPMDHIAKGYAGGMMSFKQQLTAQQGEEVVAYLKSQGTLISTAVPKPMAAVASPKPESQPVVEAPAPVMEAAPVRAPTRVIEQPAAPKVEVRPEAPVAPEPKSEKKGLIFI